MIKHVINSKIKALFPKKPFDWLIYGAFILAIFKLVDLYTDINEHEDNWNEFKQEHHCELKKTSEGNQKLAWSCDDGKTYYRWRQVLR